MQVLEAAPHCHELGLHSTRILLDYTVDETASLNHVPPCCYPLPSKSPKQTVKIGGQWMLTGEECIELPTPESLELSTISAVLVTSAEQMLALPILTEYTDFHGIVIATTAAAQLGHHLMLEQAAYHAQSHEFSLNRDEPLVQTSVLEQDDPIPVERAKQLWDLVARSRRPYTKQDVLSCSASIRRVSFNESIQLETEISVSPVPSGAAVGAAHWIVKAYGQRAILFGSTELPTNLAPQLGLFDSFATNLPLNEEKADGPGTRSDDTTVCSASRPFELNSRQMSDADLILLTHVRPSHVPSGASQMRSACELVCRTCAAGGRVLLPCTASGEEFCFPLSIYQCFHHCPSVLPSRCFVLT